MRARGKKRSIYNKILGGNEQIFEFFFWRDLARPGFAHCAQMGAKGLRKQSCFLRVMEIIIRNYIIFVFVIIYTDLCSRKILSL